MEDADIQLKKSQVEWLREVLAEQLAGSGLRPEVEWLGPVEEEDPAHPGRTKVIRKAHYLYSIVCPLEWKVTNHIHEESPLPRMAEITEAVLLFWREAWPERICTDWQYDIWRRVPGFFDWATEQAPVILYRIAMQRLTQRFGPRNIKGITLYDDLLIVHTRRGNFRIDMDNFRDRLEETVGRMDRLMRRPIRYRYLQEIRQNKKNEQDGQPEK